VIELSFMLVLRTQSDSDDSQWVAHYNRARPHSGLGPGLGPGIPELGGERLCGYAIPGDHRVLAEPILGGLHCEYRLERVAA
jgi:hypothetical protein